jgi:hypothetical protein
MGGGATSDFPNITVHRFGAINLRTALRYARDLLWREIDAQEGQGYRPDRLEVAFGGFSAGGFGTIYNYHWVLDDLQWPHTSAYPDSALALDSGHPFWSIRNLAPLVIEGEPPITWAALEYQPPYCFGGDCAVGPHLLTKTAPRLKAVPEQQFLIISNQNDEEGQMVTTHWTVDRTYEQGRVDWINAARQSYCDTKGLNGVHYYLMPFAGYAGSSGLHSQTLDDYFFADVPVAGQTMNDWLWSAMSQPDVVVDRVEEESSVLGIPSVTTIPCLLPECDGRVEPFDCELPPPSE